MGWQTNIALLVVVGGLGTYLMLTDEKVDAPPKDPTQMSTKLLPRGAWDARQIWFEPRSGREPIILDLDPANRRVTVSDPVRDVASMAVVKSILDPYHGALVVLAYSAAELAAEPRLLKETGVDDPKGQIEFRYSLEDVDDVVRIAFGHPGIRAGEIWVKVGDAIYRTDPALLKLLDKLPDTMREHLLFTDTDVGVPQKVRIEKREGTSQRVHLVEQTGRTEFHLIEPLRARADRAAVKGLLEGVGSLYVRRFLSGAGQDPIGEDHDFRIVVKGDKGSETLDVSILDSGVYLGRLRRRNIVFELDPRGLKALEGWLPKLRDKKLHHIAERSILRLELDPGEKGRAALFVRGSNQGFHIEKPIKISETNSTPMGELMHVLTTMEAKTFVDDPTVETGLEDGADFFTIRLGSQREYGLDIAIRIGKDAGEGLVYARREDESSVVTLEKSAADVIRRPWIELISLKVPQLKTPAFYLEAHVPGRSEPIVYINRDLEWRESGVKTEAVDVREFVTAIKTLRAKAVVEAAGITKGEEPVRVILRGDQHAQSAELYKCTMHRHGDHVLLQVDGYPGIAYRIEQKHFRHLLDDWLSR